MIAAPARIVLRDYQATLYRELHAARQKYARMIVQLATGGGKTVLAAYIIQDALDMGLTCWFVVHRKELLDQTSETFTKYGVRHSFIASGRPANSLARMQICTVQTLYHRLQKGKLRPPHLIIIDECHHAVAKMWMTVIEAYPRAWQLGLTATPARADGKGLKAAGYQVIISGPSPSTLIGRGHLADYDIIGVPPSELPDLSGIRKIGGDYAKGDAADVVEKAILGDAPSQYLKHIAPGTCLVYCTLRKSARNVTERYRAMGIDAHYVAGDTPKRERNRVIHAFRRGDVPVVVSVDLFGEGLDAPGLKGVQMLRPTMSMPLYRQQVGRALRPDVGRVVILDPVGNVWRHGLPDDEVKWTLGDGCVIKGDRDPALRITSCDFCFAIFRTAAKCPACGMAVTAKKNPLPEKVGEIEKLDKKRIREERKKMQRQRKWRIAAATTLQELTTLAVEFGYKPGWAAMRMAHRTGKPFHYYIGAEKRIRKEL